MLSGQAHFLETEDRIMQVTTRQTRQGVAYGVDFTEEVNRGADMLDRLLPGWEFLVQPTKLSLEDPNYCVLGQMMHQAVFADILGTAVANNGYHEAVVGLIKVWEKRNGEVFPVPFRDQIDGAAAYGFLIQESRLGYALAVEMGIPTDDLHFDPYEVICEVSDGCGVGYDTLTKQWLKVIRDRRKAKREAGQHA